MAKSQSGPDFLPLYKKSKRKEGLLWVGPNAAKLAGSLNKPVVAREKRGQSRGTLCSTITETTTTTDQ